LLRVFATGSKPTSAGSALLPAMDFGTATSVVAVHDPARGWVPIRDGDGRFLVPLVVTFT
jgi:hypothetical protein